MAKIRIYALAKELKLENKKLLLMLKKRGVLVKNALNSVDDNLQAVREIKELHLDTEFLHFPDLSSSFSRVDIYSGNKTLPTNITPYVGLAFSIVAILIVISFSLKMEMIPKSISSLLQFQKENTDQYLAMKTDFNKMKSEFMFEKKMTLKRDLEVIKHLSKKTKGLTGGKLKRLGKDMTLLLLELNRESY